MGALLALIWRSRAGKWLGGAAAALAGLLTLLLATFHSGAQAVKNKSANQQLNEVSDAKKIDDAVLGRDTAVNRKRLRQWSRD